MRAEMPDPPSGGLPGHAMGSPPPRQRAGKPSTGKGPDYPPGTPGHRAQIEGAFRQVMGMSAKAARDAYDKQLADWEANYKDKNREKT